MKKTIKVIIIENDDNIKRNLINYFKEGCGIKILSTFDNGEVALNYIINHINDIDIIITELLLPGLDGESLLNEINKKKNNIKTIVTTSYKDSNIIYNLNNYNIKHYLLKPYSLLTLEKKIRNCFSKIEYSNSNNTESKISKILHDLGIPSHISGYNYIKDGILIMCYNNVKYVTKEIYPVLANKYDSTPSRVERSMRHAIEVSTFRGNLKLMEEIFGFSVDFENTKPTNFEFISTIAEKIKLEQNT